MLSISLSLLLSAIAILAIKVIMWLLKYFEKRAQLSSLPAIEGPPFLGIIMKVVNLPVEDIFPYLLQEWNGLKEKGLALVWWGTTPEVYLFRPEFVEVVFRSAKHTNKSKFYGVFTPWLGDGLLTAKGAIWSHFRKLLTPSFHFSILDNFAPTISEKAEILSEYIQKQIQVKPNEPINVVSELSKCSLDIICETAMGVCEDVMRKPPSEYFKDLRKFNCLAIKRISTPFSRNNFIYYLTEVGIQYKKCLETLIGFSSKVIRQKEESRKISRQSIDDSKDKYFGDHGKKKHKAFLDLLIEADEKQNTKMTRQQLRENVDTIMFAGHDTTATALSWTLFALGNNLQIQEKLHQELKEVFGNGDYEPATPKQLGQLDYLDRVIKEALRLYAIAPVIGRELGEDITLGEYKLPKGLTVSIPIFEIHNDPSIWKNPKKFDPDRFLPENSKGRHIYAYIPFSAGPRNCIGQRFALLEMKTVIVALLRKFRVKSVLKHNEVTFTYVVNTKPANEILELLFEHLQ